MGKELITIFTPTFNRVGKLHDCYESLRRQTSWNFRWQVIDDGSTDDTETQVKKWQLEAPFQIDYTRLNNGGKCRAINYSMEITNTELWLCLDSDDYLVPDAIVTITKEYEGIRNNDNICGLFSLRGRDELNSMQGVEIPNKILETTQRFIRYQLKIPPEYAHVFKTKVISKFRYPSIPGEIYFPLSYVFDQIDDNYIYKVIHNPIMICEYRKDGLTKNKRNVICKNPVGYTMYKKQLVSRAPSFKEKCKAISTYITGCMLSKSNPFENNNFKTLTILLFPIGFMDYFLRYKFKFHLDLEIKTKNI